VSSLPPPRYAPDALKRASDSLPPALARDWLWWNLPAASRSNLHLIDLLEPEPKPSRWRSPEQTEALLAELSAASRRELEIARMSGGRHVATAFRRTRKDGPQWEARFDGLAGCFRTAGGGSSRQMLIEVEGAGARTRLVTAREAARLMGLPDGFRLPARQTDALDLVGDGVAPPVVKFLSKNLLLPLLQA
jgi:DNA (cytosine-5)-methyltransferase 1